MTEAELVTHFPRLYHMAEAGTWPSIRAHGLESTSALLDRFGVRGAARAAVESARRAAAVTVTHPDYGTAVVRDQRPIAESVLARCLTGLTPRAWYRLLNRQVFFWPTEERLRRLLGARFNRGRPHCLLTVDTAALLARHGRRVRLSPINSGCTRPPMPRGRGTFRTVAAYPFAERCRRRKPAEAVAEVTVLGKVPDIADVVLRVEHVRGGVVEEVIWERARLG